MLFNDEDLRLNITNIASGKKISFKSYLEDSDITYEIKDQQLPFAPTSFTNDSMAIRVTEKAKFTFNIFSESRDECTQNYRNLNKLLSTIKPSYKYVYDQIAPNTSNVTGFFNIKFKGLPAGRDNVTLHLNSFSYNINKDLGYIHVPTAELEENGSKSFYSSQGMKLIPIGYKISLEGKILLNFKQTANVYGAPSRDPNIDAASAAQAASGDFSSTEKEIARLRAERQELIKYGVNQGWLDNNGDPITTPAPDEIQVFESIIENIKEFERQITYLQSTQG